MGNIYDNLVDHLDPDERLVYPHMYKRTPWLYDKVCGVLYLLKDESATPTVYDWVWEEALTKVMRPGIVILAKMMLVRVRGPEGRLPGWVVSEEEYQANKELYTVLDTCVVAVRREYPRRTETLTVEEYQALLNDYDPIGFCYLVRSAYPGVNRL